jgi:hypothetical protein
LRLKLPFQSGNRERAHFYFDLHSRVKAMLSLAGYTPLLRASLLSALPSRHWFIVIGKPFSMRAPSLKDEG